MTPEQKTAVLVGALSQAQAQVDVLTEALALHTDGYKSDQAFIDTEIQVGRDALATEMATKDATITERDIQIADLQSKLDAAVALAQAEPTPLTDSTLATP